MRDYSCSKTVFMFFFGFEPASTFKNLACLCISFKNAHNYTSYLIISLCHFWLKNSKETFFLKS